jgi:hypothetical protein
MDLEGSPGSDSCGKCHNRQSGAYGGIGRAHDASIRYLTRDLRDDHPFSVSFPSHALDPGFNQPTIAKDDGGRMFPNGIQTFEGTRCSARRATIRTTPTSATRRKGSVSADVQPG